MSRVKELKLTIKATINKDNTEVLFAEVGSDFADVLLSVLTLPLGKIMKLLSNHYGEKNTLSIGSLNTLYKGLENLHGANFWRASGKDMLLNPRNAYDIECRKLKLNIDDTPPAKYFYCGCFYKGIQSRQCCCTSISFHQGIDKSPCGKLMQTEVPDELYLRSDSKCNVVRDVFTKKTVSFLMYDDLRMVPNVINAIKDLGITDTYGAKITFAVGFNEIMDLLRGSLLSSTPLSDLILQKTRVQRSPMVKDKQFSKLYLTVKDKSWWSRKMNLKVMIQKSTNMFLFAKTKQDFVDMLFSFLTIPLGQVENLLGSNASLGSIDNLYKSLSNLNEDTYLRNRYTKDLLLKPDLPPKYLSKNQLFPLHERKSVKLQFLGRVLETEIIDPKGEGSYVKEGGMYMVTDDLTVTPLHVLSVKSLLEDLKIPLSDAEEHEISIGSEEALSILKATLSSTNAFTRGLNSFMMKQIKEGRLQYLSHVLLQKVMQLE